MVRLSAPTALAQLGNYRTCVFELKQILQDTCERKEFESTYFTKIYLNVADRRTDRQTDDVQSHNRAVRSIAW